jgi:hypothetical protein
MIQGVYDVGWEEMVRAGRYRTTHVLSSGGPIDTAMQSEPTNEVRCATVRICPASTSSAARSSLAAWSARATAGNSLSAI